jgi:hypothetical protein
LKLKQRSHANYDYKEQNNSSRDMSACNYQKVLANIDQVLQSVDPFASSFLLLNSFHASMALLVILYVIGGGCVWRQHGFHCHHHADYSLKTNIIHRGLYKAHEHA